MCRRFKRVILPVLLITIALASLNIVNARGSYENGLEDILAASPQDSMIQVLVCFYDALDPGKIRKEVYGMSLPDKRLYVTERLKDNFKETAGDAIHWLESEYSEGRAEYLNPLWIAHSYLLRLRADRIPVIAEHPQVRRLVYDPPVKFEDCTDEVPEEEAHDDDNPVPLQQWGLDYLGSPVLWEQGYKGRGGLIAVIDTGIYILHSDLEDHIWYNEDEIPDNGIDDDDNGFIDDVNGWNFYDDNNDLTDVNGHGTKAAGVSVGDGSGGDTTGVAPEATLMVIRNWASGWSSQATHPLAVQYAIDNGAQVISSSLSYDRSNGTDPFDETHRNTQEFSLISGVIQTNSQGNNGNSPGPPDNVNAPAKCPPPWIHPDQTLVGGTAAIIAIGRHNSNGIVYNSSTRGPVEWYADFFPEFFRDYPYLDGDEMGLMRPDVLGPGSGTTCSRYGGYTTFNGESCASPYVAGSLVLLRSIHQQATPEAVCEAVKMTAEDGGDPGHDNDYGAGNVQIHLAHDYLDEMYEYGSLNVTARLLDGEPVSDARVEVGNNEVRAWTGEDGSILLERIWPDEYDIHVYSEEYGTGFAGNIEIVVDETTEIEIFLLETTIVVTPQGISETISQNDTLEVTLAIENLDEEEITLDAFLRPAGGTDVLPDQNIVIEQALGAVVTEGIAVIDSKLVVAGVRDGGESHKLWQFDFDGVLIDSLDQPGRFENGLLDLAPGNDNTIVCYYEGQFYTLNSEWEVIDSLLVAYDDVAGAGYNMYGDIYLLSSGQTIYQLDESGFETGSYTTSEILPTGLAYHPDDLNGDAVYAYGSTPAGEIQLVSFEVDSGEESIMAAYDPPEGHDPRGLAFENVSSKPYWRLWTLQDVDGIRRIDREINSSAYELPVTIEIAPGGTNVQFEFYGPACTPGSFLDMEILLTDEAGDPMALVPVDLQIIDYSTVSGEISELPLNAELFPPFPNPFNSKVQLEYKLAVQSEVTLAVYNVLGQQVAILDQGRRETGGYVVSWDAEEMATGLYIAVLEVGEERHAQKLLLVR